MLQPCISAEIERIFPRKELQENTFSSVMCQINLFSCLCVMMHIIAVYAAHGRIVCFMSCEKNGIKVSLKTVDDIIVQAYPSSP